MDNANETHTGGQRASNTTADTVVEHTREALLVERGASTGRRDGGEERVASADPDRSGSSWLLPKPNAFASAQGTGNEKPEGAGSNPAPGTDYWFRRDQLGDPACPYITRWVLNLGPLGTVRLHHWYGNDDQRAHHDHPWGFFTIMLWGTYDDVTDADDGGRTTTHVAAEGRVPYEHVDRLRMGSVRWRPATHTHTVRTNGAWTLLWTQPKLRHFGFWVRLPSGRVRWFKANKFFGNFGHPPCAD